MDLYFSITLVTGTANPHFEWLQDRSSDSGIPVLSVTFPENLDKDEIHLEQSNFAQGDYDAGNEESCMFEGKLKNEPDSHVVATGCPGSRVEVLTFTIEFIDRPHSMNIK